jgi:hypothetical protein
MNKIYQAQFSASLIGQSVQDPNLTVDVVQRHNMGHNSAIVSKKKFQKALAPIKACYSLASQEFRALTYPLFPRVPVVVEGEREKLIAAMAKHQAIFEALVDEFVANYDEHMETERICHNGSFRASDYPTREEAAEHFKWNFQHFPLPSPDQFLEPHLKSQWAEEMAGLESNITKNAGRQLLELVKDCAQILGDPDKKLVEGEKKKGILHKLREFNDRIPQLNIKQDPQLEALRQTVQLELDYTGKMLREDEELRLAVAAKAAETVATFGQFNRKIAA